MANQAFIGKLTSLKFQIGLKDGMRIQKRCWSTSSNWDILSGLDDLTMADLVLAFGQRQVIENPDRFEELRSLYPHATILSCSSSGDINGADIYDESISTTAIQFQKTILKSASVSISGKSDHSQVGFELAEVLKGPNLKLVFILSDGHSINAGEFIRGLNKVFGDHVPITGGLAGDGVDFARTVVGLDETPTPNQVVAIGLYGNDLKVGHGSMGGWDPIGPERIVTKSKGNTLYELDGESALDLYKNYLGDRADELPGAALLFPLSLEVNAKGDSVVRTVLSIDEKNQSMQFAGDLPAGSRCQLMIANFEKIIDASSLVAESCLSKMDGFEPELAILISCVGRRIVLGQRVEEELEEAIEVIGPNATVSGFYSYGELSPLVSHQGCQLHNQTMTITTLAEA